MIKIIIKTEHTFDYRENSNSFHLLQLIDFLFEFFQAFQNFSILIALISLRKKKTISNTRRTWVPKYLFALQMY